MSWGEIWTFGYVTATERAQGDLDLGSLRRPIRYRLLMKRRNGYSTGDDSSSFFSPRGTATVHRRRKDDPQMDFILTKTDFTVRKERGKSHILFGTPSNVHYSVAPTFFMSTILRIDVLHSPKMWKVSQNNSTARARLPERRRSFKCITEI